MTVNLIISPISFQYIKSGCYPNGFWSASVINPATGEAGMGIQGTALNHLSREIPLQEAQESQDFLLFKNNIFANFIHLIRQTVVDNELEVWKFQIGQGLCCSYGFENEAYAFKSKNRLFIITFGWAD